MALKIHFESQILSTNWLVIKLIEIGDTSPQECVVGIKIIAIFIFIKQVYWNIWIVWKYAMVSTMVKDGLNLIQIPN